MMNPETPRIGKRELRQFGLIMGAMIVLFFAVLIPWIWGTGISPAVFVIAALFAAFGLLLPQALGPVYALWMKIGGVLGWINTRIILSLVFFLLFVPLGFFLRMRRDPMRRKLEPDSASYTEPAVQPSVDNLEKPY